MPHAKHINQMLLGDVIFLVNVSLQSGENVPLLDDILSTTTFYLKESLIGNTIGICQGFPVFGRNSKVFKFLSEDYDRLLAEEWILRGRRASKVRR